MKDTVILGQPKENWMYLFILLGGGILTAVIGTTLNGGGV